MCWCNTKTAVRMSMIVMLLFFLTGCDKKELEERAYVTALSIDQTADRQIELTLIKATNSLLDEMEVVQTVGKSVQEASYKLSRRGNESVYFGITHTIVLGDALLQDEQAFKRVIDNLTRDMDLSKDVFVLSTEESASELVKNLPQGKTSATSPKFDTSKLTTLNQLNQKTLEQMVASLYRTGGTVIPQVTVTDDYLEIVALALIKHHEKTGTLDQAHLPGYLFLLGQGAGQTVENGQDHTVVTVVSVNRRLDFFDTGTQPGLLITLEIETVLDEYMLSHLSEEVLKAVQDHCNQLIKAQALAAYEQINDCQDSYLGFWEAMRKHQHDMYQRYWGEQALVVDMLVNVTVDGTGASL